MSSILRRINSQRRILIVANFGDQLVPYGPALKLQETLRSALHDHQTPDVLIQLQVEGRELVVSMPKKAI